MCSRAAHSVRVIGPLTPVSPEPVVFSPIPTRQAQFSNFIKSRLIHLKQTRTLDSPVCSQQLSKRRVSNSAPFLLDEWLHRHGNSHVTLSLGSKKHRRKHFTSFVSAIGFPRPPSSFPSVGTEPDAVWSQLTHPLRYLEPVMHFC